MFELMGWVSSDRYSASLLFETCGPPSAQFRLSVMNWKHAHVPQSAEVLLLYTAGIDMHQTWDVAE